MNFSPWYPNPVVFARFKFYPVILVDSPAQCVFNSEHVKIREGSPEGNRVTMEERICERDEF